MALHKLNSVFYELKLYIFTLHINTKEDTALLKVNRSVVAPVDYYSLPHWKFNMEWISDKVTIFSVPKNTQQQILVILNIAT